MVRITLLLLLLGGLVGAEVAPDAPPAAAEPAAAEAAPAATDAVEAAPPATAEPAPVFETVTIANRHARLTVTTNCAAVTRFELIGMPPVELPPALRARSHSPVLDPDSDLPILDDFHHAPQNPNWNPRWGLHNKFDFSSASQVNLDDTIRTPWTVVERGADHVTMEMASQRTPVKVRIAYRMEVDRPSVLVEVTLRNTGTEARHMEPRIAPIFGGIVQDYPPNEQYYLCGFTHSGSITNHGLPDKSDSFPLEGLDYLGVKSRFFAAIWQPMDIRPRSTAERPDDGSGLPGSEAVADAPVADAAKTTGTATFWPVTTAAGNLMVAAKVDFAGIDVAAGAEATLGWRLTVTSMTKDDLALLSEPEQRVQYTDGFYRFFKSLANLLAICLDAIAIVVRNYGVALIVLTFLIKLALHRFTFKQQASMLKMSKLAPEIKLLQERYKNDRQQLGLKTMEMYKKHGVNPLSGCLPMFIQMPMFMALYQVFTHSADFRGAGFLWIKDLTLEDAIWGIDHPWLHWLTINPLALIYIGVTLWMSFQTKIPEGADPQQAQMQKMMRWLPLIFGVIFYHMPAGLVLYFTVNAILSTIEIKMVKKKLGMP